MKNEVNEHHINVNMADFHGLDDSNPYKSPKYDDNPFNPVEYVEIGFWGYTASIILIIWYACLSYVFLTIFSEHENLGVFSIVLTSITVLICLVHLLSLFKVEVARKLVVCHSFILLLGIPIGTVIGAILLKNFKGKKYFRT